MEQGSGLRWRMWVAVADAAPTLRQIWQIAAFPGAVRAPAHLDAVAAAYSDTIHRRVGRRHLPGVSCGATHVGSGRLSGWMPARRTRCGHEVAGPAPVMYLLVAGVGRGVIVTCASAKRTPRGRMVRTDRAQPGTITNLSTSCRMTRRGRQAHVLADVAYEQAAEMRAISRAVGGGVSPRRRTHDDEDLTRGARKLFQVDGRASVRWTRRRVDGKTGEGRCGMRRCRRARPRDGG